MWRPAGGSGSLHTYLVSFVCRAISMPRVNPTHIAFPSPLPPAYTTSTRTEDCWQATLENLPQMVWSMSDDGTDEYYNSRWIEFTGVKPGTPTTPSRLELIHPEDRARALAVWQRSFSTRQPYECEYRLWHISGEYRWILSRGLFEKEVNGESARWYGTATDVHERVLAMRALHENNAFNRGIVETTPDSIALLDFKGVVIFVNRAFAVAVDAADPAEIIGKPWRQFVPAKGRRAALSAFGVARSKGCGRFTMERRLGKTRQWWDIVIAPLDWQGASSTRLVIIARDSTQQKAAEERVHWTANHDALTRLPNRILFHQRLDLMIAEGHASGQSFALLLLDIDHLKRTNDAFGHDAGDTLLRGFAKRLAVAARPGDIAARLGGDEFAMLIAGVADAADLEAAVRDISTQLQRSCIHEGAILECRASIGASIYPQYAGNAQELLKQADLALYAAKASGRGTLRIFQPSMQAEINGRNAMLGSAKVALRDDRIVPFYQPKVDLRSGRVVGFEALLRHHNPKLGIQTPDTIAAAFDDAILAPEISDCMIGQIIADLSAWKAAGIAFGHVAINAASAEFRCGDFAGRLLDRLNAAHLPTSSIQVEVTENVFIGHGAEHVERALRTLSAVGVQIALDDFGTGYASLSHLKQFPVDIIKIDRSFIRNLQIDEDDGAIVDAVICLGKSLKIEIVAEGIETAAQHDVLAALGCDYGQGFLYGPAVPAIAIPALLQGTLMRRMVVA